MTDIDKILQQKPRRVTNWRNVIAILLIAIFPLPMILLFKKPKKQ